MPWYFFIRFSSQLRGHGTIYAMIFLHAFQFTRLHGHGTIYAMIFLYSFQFTVTRTRGHGNVYAICIVLKLYLKTLAPSTVR